MLQPANNQGTKHIDKLFELIIIITRTLREKSRS